MRELIARLICFLALAVVIALALLFAVRHNSTRTVPGAIAVNQPVTSNAAVATRGPEPLSATRVTTPAATPVSTNQAGSATSADRGREIFAQQKCMSCHSIEGSGNPRYPLDATGARWQPEELREWITGTGVAAERLSSTIIRRKQRYRELSEAEINSLVQYLSTLKQPTETP